MKNPPCSLSTRKRAIVSKEPCIAPDPMDDNNPIMYKYWEFVLPWQLQTIETRHRNEYIGDGCMAASNVIISFLCNLIPNRIRIIVQLVAVAAMVVLVDQVLAPTM